MVRSSIEARYFRLLKSYVMQPEEEHLAATGELGRELVMADVPEEDVAEIHEKAVHRLAEESPQMPLRHAAHLISAPLVELFMAYGLAFRERLDEREQYSHTLEAVVKERTAELAAARDRAEESDRLKSAFLAVMSHELRTPLNSIIGFTSIVLQGLAGPLSEEQTRQLGMVQGSARHLLELINDVLDISRIEAGEVEIVLKAFDVPEAIEKAVQKVIPLAEKKGLTLAVEVAPEVDRITSDRRRVEQILINLLNNAVKFTEHGEVRIECCLSNDRLVTRVMDTGIGINPEDVGKLFTEFRQLDTGLNRKQEGSGLGLSICKKLVALLDGDIRVESKPGEGSVFTFTLPIKTEE
jgi:hypothetical protein